jgi:hypothetical protein
MTSKTHTTVEAETREARQEQVRGWLEDHQIEMDRLGTERDSLDMRFRFLTQARGSSPTSERERVQSVHETTLRYAEIESAIIIRSIAAGTLKLELVPNSPDPIELAAAEQAATEAIAIRDGLRRQALEAQRGRDDLERSLHGLGKQQAEAVAKVATRRRQAAQAGQQGPLAAKRLVIAS